MNPVKNLLVVACATTGLFFAPMEHANAVHAATLTSITIDPQDQYGATTNAPGAWSSNTGDPLSQAGVKSEDGIFLNKGAESGNLGEVFVDLQPGITALNIVGNGVFPANSNYGATLFFDNVAVNPQIAVFNENGNLGAFKVQPSGSTIMGGANGGVFFDKAPGTSVYVVPDGSKVEVLSFVINSMSSNTDEISYGHIGADGTPDTTAQLILRVTPPQNLKGCLELKGSPIIGSEINFKQPGEMGQTAFTDENGCYSFDELVSRKKFTITIKGPVVP